jgi:hypothetical protein
MSNTVNRFEKILHYFKNNTGGLSLGTSVDDPQSANTLYLEDAQIIVRAVKAMRDLYSGGVLGQDTVVVSDWPTTPDARNYTGVHNASSEVKFSFDETTRDTYSGDYDASETDAPHRKTAIPADYT